jgi:HD-GYP domain-containing protein (c-di-GMP phosphodiesterase class II)
MRRTGQPDATSYLETIRVLGRSVERRTPHRDGHASRVAGLAAELGAQLRLDRERLHLIEIAGELHDLGYVGVPDRIMEKPGPLEDAEYRVVQTHPDMGARILASIDLPEVVPWVRAHHERWDGRGYPRGLSGSEIPLGARILAVCDAYDAITHERPYRRALRHDEALEELGMGRGSAFDPGVVDEFFFMLKSHETKDADGD